jgi:hypothetical protein
MLISPTANLDELAEIMAARTNTVAAPEDAATFLLTLLRAGYGGKGTDDIDLVVWRRLLDETFDPNEEP